jgi:hypothetical protein
MMFGWKSPLAHRVGIPVALAGAAVAVVLAFRVTGPFFFLGGFSLVGCMMFGVINVPVALVGAAPGLIVGEIINSLANRRG